MSAQKKLTSNTASENVILEAFNVLLAKNATLEAEIVSLKSIVSALQTPSYQEAVGIAQTILDQHLDATTPTVAVTVTPYKKPRPQKLLHIDNSDLAITSDLDESHISARKGKDNVRILNVAEATAVLQLPQGILKNLVTIGKVPAELTYKKALEFYNANIPMGSAETKLMVNNYLSILYSSHVERLLGISHDKLRELAVKNKLIPTIQYSHTHIGFYWKDVVEFVKKSGMSYTHCVIPHKFYQGLYLSAKDDAVFSHLTRLCVPAMVMKEQPSGSNAKKTDYPSEEWNKARDSLVELEPSLVDFMASRKTDILGHLSVLHWLKEFRPEMLSDMRTLGYIGYLGKYARFSKDGNIIKPE